MGKRVSLLRRSQPSSNKGIPQNRESILNPPSFRIRTKSMLSYMPSEYDTSFTDNIKPSKLHTHDGPVNTLAIIKPDTCISGGKDKLLVQVMCSKTKQCVHIYPIFTECFIGNNTTSVG